MTIGHKRTLVFILCSGAMLGGCEERKNPILLKPTHEVLNWIDQNKTTEVEACAQYWADPQKALKIDLKLCKPVAQNLINEMNYQGLVENAQESDIYLPVIWRELHKKFEARANIKKETAKQNAEVKSQPKSIFGNFPTNTKW